MSELIFIALLGVILIFTFTGSDKANRKKARIAATDQEIQSIVDWADQMQLAVADSLSKFRWLDRNFKSSWLEKRPQIKSPAINAVTAFCRRNGVEQAQVFDAITIWKDSASKFFSEKNEEFTQSELESCAEFFRTIEKTPLTEEQCRAVICMDNWVQVVAAAGSGKTSVMVAKAAYAIHRNLVDPERILLLAFNKGAAEELRERCHENLARAGLGTKTLKATTFHAFGLEVIGDSTGRKPRLAGWVEHDSDKERFASKIVSELRLANSEFDQNWHLLTTVFSRDLPAPDETVFEDWDPVSKRRGFQTLDGKIVKSHGERQICDWLFLHGVQYMYERPYEHDVATPSRSQYRPDFFYPDANLYHEHFALDRSGNPPTSFTGYLEGVHWKRALHRDKGTDFIETTYGELIGPIPFRRLKHALESRGIRVAFDPSRISTGRQPIPDLDLVKKLLVFLTHYKASRTEATDLRQRASGSTGRANVARHQIFCDVFLSFYDAWQLALKEDRSVDFDDMLGIAADELLAAKEPQRFDLILVDEFQDTSIARLDLVKNLVKSGEAWVTVVGDDWQSINRFAGADLSTTTNFRGSVGESTTLNLTRTFRCPQAIASLAGNFVMKNPAQLRKAIHGRPDTRESAISIVLSDEGDRNSRYVERKRSVRRVLEDIARDVVDEPESCIVLGRYNHEISPTTRPDITDLASSLAIGFHTIHRSKGREADHIIVVGLEEDKKYGFPSAMKDDPVLEIIMPEADPYPFAEERRLLYVAITRAKKSVTLLGNHQNPSRYIRELYDEFKIPFRFGSDEMQIVKSCPQCGSSLAEKKNRLKGKPFFGCSSFPSCSYTEAYLGARS